MTAPVPGTTWPCAARAARAAVRARDLHSRRRRAQARRGRRACARRVRLARKLRAMHGMLSAAIVIGVLAVAAAACLYVVVRVYLAGTRRGPATGPGHDGS